ncbi:MAG: hypothetical protein WAK60_12110 [Sedimentisphaerales bacterium]
MKLREELSAPLGFADHQGRHLLKAGPAIVFMDTTSVARIPTDVEQLDSQG